MTVRASQPAKDDDAQLRRAAAFELHCAWLRLRLAQIHIEHAQVALRDGFVSPTGALAAIEEAMGEVVGEAA